MNASLPPGRVILLGNYLPDEQESMQRYARMMQQKLEEAGWHVTLLQPPVYFGRLRRSGRGLGKWLGYLDKFLVFPFQLRRVVRAEEATAQAASIPFLVHICDHSNAMYVHRLHGVSHLITCHDLIAVETALERIQDRQTRLTGRILQRWILSGLRKARAVVCVSEATRRGLLALAPGLETRCAVVPNPLAYPYTPMAPDLAAALLAPWNLGEGRYLFHIGGNQWYKNREGVVRIFARLLARHPEVEAAGPLRLVLAGQWPSAELEAVVNEEKLTGRVVFTGRLSDEQLRAAYSRAEALIFPSLREGFGWPILEAQACGCPVVASDRSPMKEVAGPAALVADPDDTVAFAEHISRLLRESPLESMERRQQARDYANRSDSFSFLKRMLEIYKSSSV